MSAASTLRRSLAGPMVRALGSSGVLELCARAQGRAGAVILMYHSVAAEAEARWIDPQNHVSPEMFRRQMEFLSRERRVISLSAMIDAVRRGETPEPGSVVITFDDGYLDNLTVAAPVLKEFGFPAVLFLPTGYIDRAENQWIDVMWSAFRYCTRDELAVTGLGEYVLTEAAARDAAYRAVCEMLLSASYAERQRMVREVLEQLRPSKLPPRLTMNWEDVRRLVREFPLFEIGGHTVNHADMSAVDEDAGRGEVAGCRERIGAELGVLPRHFSFPYGRATVGARALVAGVGFESACGGGVDPLIRGGVDPFALRRIAAPRTMDRFAFLTSAANSGLFHRLSK